MSNNSFLGLLVTKCVLALVDLYAIPGDGHRLFHLTTGQLPSCSWGYVQRQVKAISFFHSGLSFMSATKHIFSHELKEWLFLALMEILAVLGLALFWVYLAIFNANEGYFPQTEILASAVLLFIAGE